MAPISDPTALGISEYVGARLGVATEFVADAPWQERARLFDRGAIHACWICGLPYVRRADRADAGVELLAAPVPEGERYGDRPVYFSDVVVRREAPFRSFEDLRGAAWAYNEPASHSGYSVVLAHLAKRGERAGFFGRATETGAHEVSLRMILDGDLDGAAIDTTVLDLAVAQDPTIAERIRTIATLGPSPIPPWVVRTALAGETRRGIRKLLVAMHEDSEGAEVLRRGRIRRLVPVEDRYYDAIREMARSGAGVLLASRTD